MLKFSIFSQESHEKGPATTVDIKPLQEKSNTGYLAPFNGVPLKKSRKMDNLHAYFREHGAFEVDKENTETTQLEQGKFPTVK